jgi:hypothetical protein
MSFLKGRSTEVTTTAITTTQVLANNMEIQEGKLNIKFLIIPQ